MHQNLYYLDTAGEALTTGESEIMIDIDKNEVDTKAIFLNQIIKFHFMSAGSGRSHKDSGRRGSY